MIYFDDIKLSKEAFNKLKSNNKFEGYEFWVSYSENSQERILKKGIKTNVLRNDFNPYKNFKRKNRYNSKRM